MLDGQVGFALNNGHQSNLAGLKSADFVAKVGNRTTLKISPKLIFELICCCVAFQRYYAGP